MEFFDSEVNKLPCRICGQLCDRRSRTPLVGLTGAKREEVHGHDPWRDSITESALYGDGEIAAGMRMKGESSAQHSLGVNRSLTRCSQEQRILFYINEEAARHPFAEDLERFEARQKKAQLGGNRTPAKGALLVVKRSKTCG